MNRLLYLLMLCISVSIHAAQEGDQPSPSSKRKTPPSPRSPMAEETPTKKQKIFTPSPEPIFTPSLLTPFQLPASPLLATPLNVDTSQILLSQQALIQVLFRNQLATMEQIERLKQQLEQLTTRVAKHTALLNTHTTTINDHAGSIESHRDLINEHVEILNQHADRLEQQSATLTTLSRPLQAIFSSAGIATRTPSTAPDPQQLENPLMDHKSAEFSETQ